jgi:hypothetical protein
MTDTTQAEVLVPSYAAAKPARPAAERRRGYLFGPALDFLLLGGGSVLACVLILLLLPKGIPSAQQAVLVTVLMTVINQPHFAHSYQMFYRNYRDKAFGTYARGLRIRYVFAGLVVPILLIAFLVGTAITGNVRALAFGANIMFLTVGWHYVKQGYGILIVDSVQKRQMFSDRAKWILRANGYACWAAAWLAANHEIAQPNSYIGLTYFSIPFPNFVYYAAIGIAVATSAAVAYVLAMRFREGKGALPWNGIVAYLTTLYLWVIFVRINPLFIAVIPSFHSLQYLAVVWRYQLNAGAKTNGGTGSFLSGFWPTGVLPGLAMFIGIGMFLGFLGFMGLPRFLDAVFPYDKHLYGSSLFLFAFYIFINVHHYFLDNVMWRRGNPDVVQHIFSR